jgi:hypothetical protein
MQNLGGVFAMKSFISWSSPLLFTVCFFVVMTLLGWGLLELGALCDNPVAVQILHATGSTNGWNFGCYCFGCGFLYFVLPLVGIAIGAGGSGIPWRTAVAIFTGAHIVMLALWLLGGPFLS